MATINLHRVKAVSAMQTETGKTTWLEIRTEDEDRVSIFMPYEVAAAIAEAYKSSQENLADA